jgi:hypothetical protein
MEIQGSSIAGVNLRVRYKVFRNFGRWSAIPALFAVFAIIFYWKVLFTNRFMFPWDAADFFYPYLNFVHEELRHFHLPLWNPFVMSGYPIIGDMEAQIFYPINWLLIALHPFSSLPYRLVEIQLIFHFFLAGVFMYFLARDVTGKVVPSLIAGLLFMSSGSMVAHTEHMAIVDSMAWYPLIFLVARRALFNGKPSWTIVSGLLFGLQLLVGHWQHSTYMGLILFLYFAWHALFGPLRSKLWPRWILQLLVIAGIGVGIALIQVLPSIDLGFQSVRNRLTYWDITSGNEPSYLLTLFLPNFFGGINGVPRGPYDLSLFYVFITVPGLLLALLGILETLRRRNFFYIGTLSALIFLSLGWHGPFGKVLYAIPLLNRFRNPGMLFDPAFFLLCLMAALGAHALFREDLWTPVKRFLPWVLGALLVCGSILGVILHLGASVHGWYGMLAVLGLFFLAVVAYLRNWIGRRIALGTVSVLILFQVIHYNMNQIFNCSHQNPEIYATHDLAVGSPGLISFLRSDPNQDFRTFALAETILNANGWNIWRIPSISGWNPFTLESYENYFKEFIQCASYTSPSGIGDHELASPMLDLLGTKYLVSAGEAIGGSWMKSGKLRRVLTDSNWWSVFENKDYLSRAWFFPRAYAVPDKELATALMKSRWFEARKTLLIDRRDVPEEAAHLTEQISATHLLPNQIDAASGGRVATDEACAQPQKYFRDWNGDGSWVRFRVTGPDRPGRYTLLLRYASADPSTAASVGLSVENGGTLQSMPAVLLPRTSSYSCAGQRTAELGEFALEPGTNLITLTLNRKTPVDLYSVWLVRLPETAPAKPESFAFRDFAYAANRISLAATVSHEGFLLLNEVYYPGWEATVDGNPMEVCRVDGIFRGIQISGGTHKVELRFRPRYFNLGCAGSLATLVLSLTFLGVTRRKERKGM